MNPHTTSAVGVVAWGLRPKAVCVCAWVRVPVFDIGSFRVSPGRKGLGSWLAPEQIPGALASQMGSQSRVARGSVLASGNSHVVVNQRSVGDLRELPC